MDYRKLIKHIATMPKTSSIIRLSSREYQHCMVCGKPSKIVGSNGTSKKYKCESCGYSFSNR